MIEILEHVPLAPHTTFKIGGDARYMVPVQTEDDLREALAWAKTQDVPYFILGGGSNVLIPDEGFDGLVIHVRPGDISLEGDLVIAQAGCTLMNVIRTASDLKLGGWERLAGIPGTIGGAVRGNAGAFGVEMKDVVVRVRAMNVETLEVREFDTVECAFGYRSSFFKLHPVWAIIQITVALHRVLSEKSNELIDDIIIEREKRHLQDVKAAGSYFSNPKVSKEIQALFLKLRGQESRDGRVPSGFLIDEAGLRGTLKIGGAEVSAQHANYIVNNGTATAADVMAVAEKVKADVKEKFGVELEEEVSHCG